MSASRSIRLLAPLFVASLVAAMAPVSAIAPADLEARPTKRTTCSSAGEVCFLMEPRPARERPHGGRGHAYRYVKGRKQVLWRVEGWYAFRVLLSDDGRYLVRLGNWPRGQRPSESHLAVAFYDNGELLAEYSTRALIEDDSKVRPSSSHYTYRAHDGELSLVVGDTEKGELPLSFEFSTIDGIRYRFDVTTGEIVARSPPASEESAGAESPASSDLTPPEREG